MTTIHERIGAMLGTPAEQSWRWVDSTPAHALGARPVAYFSMEFGLHADLAIYSGGLGVLAGDHLKSASDLGLPLVAVGLCYREGYFSQTLDETGRQQQSYPFMDIEGLGIEAVLDEEGNRLRVSVETGTDTIHAIAWRVSVGNISLYLLDAQLEDNTPDTRRLTARLYGGDHYMRIRQELLLGVGGMRLLRALGVRVSAIHLNEGHSAFAGLERVRMLREIECLGLDDAIEKVCRSTVFTTHTPVPAGHDRFDVDLVRSQLEPLQRSLEMDMDRLLGLGRVHPEDPGETFCMTVLAARLSQRINGVSALHGVVSRRMWTALWPERPTHEVPIGHITNGVHIPTWIGSEYRSLFDRHLGSDWMSRRALPETWDNIENISDAELQAAKAAQKRRLIEHLGGDLNPDSLFIGFARRFATYKRATLLTSNLDRLDQILNHSERPVTILFAGKAHPRDEGGKDLIQRLYQVSQEPRFKNRIRVLEGYDIHLAQYLVQGVDLWLNNPRRPMEASGTSGQKVAFNGGLNCSVLDGWWAEGWDGQNGFAIGTSRVHRDTAVQDSRDAQDLYRVLSEQVAPLFFQLNTEGQRAEWFRTVRRAMRTLSWRFCSDRMVQDYILNRYIPAAGMSPCTV